MLLGSCCGEHSAASGNFAMNFLFSSSIGDMTMRSPIGFNQSVRYSSFLSDAKIKKSRIDGTSFWMKLSMIFSTTTGIFSSSTGAARIRKSYWY